MREHFVRPREIANSVELVRISNVLISRLSRRDLYGIFYLHEPYEKIEVSRVYTERGLQISD